jgi:hypothetical protein
MGFEMSVYIAQEFLGVLLVLATLTGTILFLGIAFILFQEGIRRAVRGTRTGIAAPRGVNAKQQWLARTHGRLALRSGHPNSSFPIAVARKS